MFEPRLIALADTMKSLEFKMTVLEARVSLIDEHLAHLRGRMMTGLETTVPTDTQKFESKIQGLEQAFRLARHVRAVPLWNESRNQPSSLSRLQNIYDH